MQEGIGFTVADLLGLRREFLDSVQLVPYDPAVTIEFGAFQNEDHSPHPLTDAFLDCLRETAAKRLTDLHPDDILVDG